MEGNPDLVERLLELAELTGGMDLLAEPDGVIPGGKSVGSLPLLERLRHRPMIVYPVGDLPDIARCLCLGTGLQVPSRAAATRISATARFFRSHPESTDPPTTLPRSSVSGARWSMITSPQVRNGK